MQNRHSAQSRSSKPRQGIVRLGSVFLAVGLAGCSSVKTHVSEGPVKARTFSFLNSGQSRVPDYAETSKEVHALVQQALIANLGARGVSQVPVGGDVTIAYLIVVGNNATTTSLNQYFGYTADSQALLEKVHSEQTGSSARDYFEAGTLVIDFVKPSDSKLLQRRSIQAQVLRNLPRDKRSARIQGLVDQALRDVPISP